MSASPEVELIESPLEGIPEIVDQARQRWIAHVSWNDKQKREFTLRQLKNFKKLIDENKKELCEAIKADLNKSEVEAIMMEINVVMGDLISFIRDFDDLVKPRPLEKGLLNRFDDMYLKPEPHGLVLIFGAWNYPFALVAQPLIGAIAAGNAVIIKPSELSVNTSNFFATRIPQYLDKNYYKVITGGVPVAQTSPWPVPGRIEMSFRKQTPSEFLKQIIGKPVVVKLNSGVDYRGVLACLDGYMNIALEQTEEYVNGQLKNKYGDAFIRGNNVLYISTTRRR